MVAQLQDIIQRFAALKRDLPDLVGGLLEENAPFIEDLQTEQRWRGIDSEGNPITPAYSPFTVQIKKLKGQPVDRVTLKDEGDFYKGMFLSGGNAGNYAIGNRDQKLNRLKSKYGEEILGLTADSKQTIIDEILRPELPERIKRFILN